MMLLAVPLPLWCDKRGFYSDDYYFVLNASNKSYFEFVFECVTGFTGANRPVDGVVHGTSFGLFGNNAGWFAFFLIAGHLLICGLLIKAFVNLGCGTVSAYYGAAFFAWMPWHGQVVYWPICLSIIVSHLLLMGSLIAFAAWLQDRRITALRWTSWGLYALSALGYEHALAWFWVWPALAWMCDREASILQSVRYGSGHMVIGSVVAAYSIGTATTDRAQNHPTFNNLWQIGRLLRQMNEQNHDSVLGIFGFHVRLLGTWVEQAPWRLLLLTSTVFAAASLLALQPSSKNRDWSAKLFRRRLTVAVVMIVCPVALMTLQTTPAFPNRSTYLTSIGLSWLAVVLLDSVERHQFGSALLGRACFVAASFLLAICGIETATRSTHWSDSWSMQQDVSFQLREFYPELPLQAVVVIEGLPLNVGPHRTPAFEVQPEA